MSQEKSLNASGVAEAKNPVRSNVLNDVVAGFLVFLILIEETNAQVKEFENWKRGRVAELTSEDGWIKSGGLNVV